MAQILGLAQTGDVVLSLAPEATNHSLIITTIVAQLRHNVDLLSADGRSSAKTTRTAVRELLRLAHIYDEILTKDTTLADLDEGQQDLRPLQLRHACARLVPGQGKGNTNDHDSLSTGADTSIREESPEPVRCTTLSRESSKEIGQSFSAKEANSVEVGPVSAEQVDVLPESSAQSVTFEAGNGQDSDVELAACESARAAPDTPAQHDKEEQHRQQPSPPSELLSEPLQPEETVILHPETPAELDTSKETAVRASTTATTVKKCAHGTHVANSHSINRRAQVPTRYTATTDELVVWIYVSSTKRAPPDVTEARALDPRWWNELYPNIASVKPNRAWKNSLGHCHLQFTSAEDRDAYAKAASQALGDTGHKVLSHLYQIEIEIDDDMTFDYLKEALADADLKRKAVRDITRDNNPHRTTKHAIRIFKIDWSNHTKRKKKRITACLGTLILTLGSASAANDMILGGFRCHGTSFAARVHKTNIILLQCERCGLLGHSRPYCTEDKARCFDCGSDEHVEESCPSPDPPCCLLCKGGHYADAFNCSIKNQQRKSVARTWPPLSQIVKSSEGGPLIFLGP